MVNREQTKDQQTHLVLEGTVADILCKDGLGAFGSAADTEPNIIANSTAGWTTACLPSWLQHAACQFSRASSSKAWKSIGLQVGTL